MPLLRLHPRAWTMSIPSCFRERWKSVTGDARVFFGETAARIWLLGDILGLTYVHLGLTAAGDENWHLARCAGGFPSRWIPTECDGRLHVVCQLFSSSPKLHISTICISHRSRADEHGLGIRFT